MEFGISLTGHVPLREEALLAHVAEESGFDAVWAWDNQVLGQDAYVILTLAAEQTARVKLGTCVTNPMTRDITVLAGVFATLNNLTGGRMICGIGRGDSAVRIRNDKPSTLKTLGESVEFIKEFGSGKPRSLQGLETHLTWSEGHELPVYVAAYGPKALELAGRTADGVILQLADPDLIRWFLTFVRAGAEAAGRDFSAIKVQCAAPMFISDDLAHARDLVRWFPAVVGNHVADLIRNHKPSDLPATLIDYVANRSEYDYRDHTRPGGAHAEYVPDEIVDRFTVVGSAQACIDRMHELEDAGVTEFNVYAKVPDTVALVRQIGASVIPQVQGESVRGRK